MSLDLKKIQARVADLVNSLRAYHDLSNKDKTKVTKSDKRRIQELEIDLKSILQPEERSDLTVDVHTVANFFGVAVRTVQTWRVKGCPKLRHGLYDLKAVFEWWVEAFGKGEESAAIEEVKLEYWRWKAENEKMKAQQTKDDLVPRADIASMWGARARLVKHNLLSLAARIPPLIEGKPQAEMRSLVRRECETIIGQYLAAGKFCPGRTD